MPFDEELTLQLSVPPRLVKEGNRLTCTVR